MRNLNVELRNSLKKQGFSLTAARAAVFAALQGEEPQTMRELSARVGTAADRASVYRTIMLFERLGIVQRLHIGWKYKLELSAAFSHHHHHLSCVSCGEVIPIEEDPVLEKRLNLLAKAKNFQPTDHQLEIRGTCSKCAK